MSYIIYVVLVGMGLFIAYAVIRFAVQHAIVSILDAQAKKVAELEAAARYAEQARTNRGEQPW